MYSEHSFHGTPVKPPDNIWGFSLVYQTLSSSEDTSWSTRPVPCKYQAVFLSSCDLFTKAPLSNPTLLGPTHLVTSIQSMNNRLFKQTLEGTTLLAWREIWVANRCPLPIFHSFVLGFFFYPCFCDCVWFTDPQPPQPKLIFNRFDLVLWETFKKFMSIILKLELSLGSQPRSSHCVTHLVSSGFQLSASQQ